MLRVTLLNAAPDTGNLGVTALSYSTIGGLARRIPNLALTVLDSGLGIRSASLLVDGVPFSYQLCGFRFSNNVLRPEANWNIRLAARLGGAWNPIARHLRNQDFVVDITGGDSFTDLYGKRRFRNLTRLKSQILNWKIPLGLLPQTYGPFRDPAHREIAVDIIRRSHFTWARDERSFRNLRDLLGIDFDPNHHRVGVDVAFLLDSAQPPGIDPQTLNWILSESGPTVGVNVSGLIYNDPDVAVSQFGFVADYRKVITDLVQRLLEQSDARILLVPHVVAVSGKVESDVTACQDVLKTFEDRYRGRLALLPALGDPREVKWIISKCNWFCGTRMHATIAGLSTGVPTAAIAYSLKTAGVFETCGQVDHVADPRELSTADVVERLWNSWSSRQDARQSLSTALPCVMGKAIQQMDEIAAACQGRHVATGSGENSE